MFPLLFKLQLNLLNKIHHFIYEELVICVQWKVNCSYAPIIRHIPCMEKYWRVKKLVNGSQFTNFSPSNIFSHMVLCWQSVLKLQVGPGVIVTGSSFFLLCRSLHWLNVITLPLIVWCVLAFVNSHICSTSIACYSCNTINGSKWFPVSFI